MKRIKGIFFLFSLASILSPAYAHAWGQALVECSFDGIAYPNPDPEKEFYWTFGIWDSHAGLQLAVPKGSSTHAEDAVFYYLDDYKRILQIPHAEGVYTVFSEETPRKKVGLLELKAKASGFEGELTTQGREKPVAVECKLVPPRQIREYIPFCKDMASAGMECHAKIGL